MASTFGHDASQGEYLVPSYITLRRVLSMYAVLACVVAAPLAQGPRQPFSRVAVTVTPDHSDWTYQPGEAVTFRIDVVRDGHQVSGATVKYGVGPEMLPPLTQATAVIGTHPLTVAGGTLNTPGFVRLVATAEIEGRTYRGVGTAGFAPDRIQPTQVNPPDFDLFWDAERKRLAALPIDAKWTPLPDYGTADVDCSQINLQNVGLTEGASRLYGILCMPKAAGRYPALLSVPGAGVRPYRGLAELAGRGLITFQIGIHGIRSSNRRRCTTAWPAEVSAAIRPSDSIRASATTTVGFTQEHCAPTISSRRCRSGTDGTWA